MPRAEKAFYAVLATVLLAAPAPSAGTPPREASNGSAPAAAPVPDPPPTPGCPAYGAWRSASPRT